MGAVRECLRVVRDRVRVRRSRTDRTVRAATCPASVEPRFGRVSTQRCPLDGGLRRAAALSIRQLVESGDRQRAGRCPIGRVYRLRWANAHGAPRLRPTPYGIPYVGVGGTEPRTGITFVDYGSESDDGFGGEKGYPIPEAAKTQPNFVEGGVAGGGADGDRHLLIVDRDRWVLYELFAARWNAAGARWEAGSGAVFDLSSNGRRPEGWTSADAAGLAILPGLVRYDEAVRGPIRHALRATVRRTNGYVWPASHRAGNTQGALPMGARLRLKSSKDLSRYPAYIQNIFRAMQTHGLIIADNGSDMFVSGAMDPRWNNDELNPAFRSLTAGDFEVVLLGWR